MSRHDDLQLAGVRALLEAAECLPQLVRLKSVLDLVDGGDE